MAITGTAAKATPLKSSYCYNQLGGKEQTSRLQRFEIYTTYTGNLSSCNGPKSEPGSPSPLKGPGKSTTGTGILIVVSIFQIYARFLLCCTMFTTLFIIFEHTLPSPY